VKTALLVLALTSSAVLARADAHTPLAGLVPDADERSERRARALESSLRPLLATLAGVERAELRVDLPDSSSAPLDRPLPVPTASVLLVLAPDAIAPADREVHLLVTGAALELAAARVSVAHTRARPTAAPPSEPRVSVRVALAVSLLANVMLATFVLARLKRRPRPARFY
jgi:type III secretory pathway lipoprotein EscJ